MWLDAIRKPEADEARCPTCGGGVCRRDYGEMHAGSFVLDGQRVEIRKRVAAGFADPVVMDAGTQYFDGGLYRLFPREKYFARGGHTLHRDVWIAAFGPVPDACHIHHRDGATFNNAIRNLECLPRGEHLSLSWQNSKANRTEHFTVGARAAAAAWHGSEAGRIWHSRHAKREKGWTKWRREPRNCPSCGAEFNCLIRKSGYTQVYCSLNCKAAGFRKRRAATREG